MLRLLLMIAFATCATRGAPIQNDIPDVTITAPAVSGMGLAFTTDGNNVKMCSEHTTGGYWSGGSWNNYGDQPTSEDCQQKCLDDPDCAFVLFRPANRFCTKYTACTRSPGIDWNWADDQVFRK